MLVDFDPAIFHIGSLPIRWYGMMYVIGFMVGSKIIAMNAQKNYINMPVEKVDGYMTYLLVGMFVFARLFYVVVYNWEDTHSFYDAIAVWKGGLSFHGAAIGFVIVSIVFSKRHNVSIWRLLDGMSFAAPQGLFFGRIGNFINGELYGRPTDAWSAMVFATDPERLPRHPSQLYESFGEGLLLFAVMIYLKPKLKRPGLMSAVFLIGYGAVRFVIEYFRQPDAQMGLYWGMNITMGQILCFLMIAAGTLQILYRKSKFSAADPDIYLEDENSNSLPPKVVEQPKNKPSKNKKKKKKRKR